MMVALLRRWAAILLLSPWTPAAWAQDAGQPAPLIDGRFSEWSQIEPIYSDAQGDGIGDVDFGRAWMTNDDRFVYLSFEVTGEVSLSDESGIVLALDTDHDASTGQPFESVGAELVWRFGERIGTFTSRTGSADVAFQDLGLASAPTVTSSVFELCLELDADPKRLGALFPSDTVLVVLRHGDSGDRLPDAGTEARFVIDRNAETRTFEVNLDRSEPASLRVLAWNVEQDGLFEPTSTSAFRNILRAAAPDVMVFSEVTGHTAAETAERVTELLPPEPGAQWFASAAPYSVVLVSRTPIVETLRVEPGGRAQGFLIARPPGFDHDVLVVGAHLKCCTENGDDATRQLEVDHIMASIRDARNGGSLPDRTPVIITGDMNFVGDSRQPRTLIQGNIVTTWLQPSFDPDWDGGALTDVIPQTTGLPLTFTWISPGAATDRHFPPGRLDYMIYTDAVLRAGNSFALYTPGMSFFERERFGLNATDTGAASDHLPIVADFVPRMTTAAETRPTHPVPALNLELYPNPAADALHVRWSDAGAGPFMIEMFDVLGRKVRSVTSSPTAGGSGHLTIDLSRLPTGFYVVTARSNGGYIRRGFVKRNPTK